jgi:hypothetical protein
VADYTDEVTKAREFVVAAEVRVERAMNAVLPPGAKGGEIPKQWFSLKHAQDDLRRIWHRLEQL